MELFDIPKEQPNKTDKRCRDCVFMHQHYWSSNVVYCEKQQSKLTHNGMLKIKKMDNICGMFKYKE